MFAAPFFVSDRSMISSESDKTLYLSRALRPTPEETMSLIKLHHALKRIG